MKEKDRSSEGVVWHAIVPKSVLHNFPMSTITEQFPYILWASGIERTPPRLTKKMNIGKFIHYCVKNAIADRHSIKPGNVEYIYDENQRLFFINDIQRNDEGIVTLMPIVDIADGPLDDTLYRAESRRILVEQAPEFERRRITACEITGIRTNRSLLRHISAD